MNSAVKNILRLVFLLLILSSEYVQAESAYNQYNRLMRTLLQLKANAVSYEESYQAVAQGEAKGNPCIAAKEFLRSVKLLQGHVDEVIAQRSKKLNSCNIELRLPFKCGVIADCEEDENTSWVSYTSGGSNVWGTHKCLFDADPYKRPIDYYVSGKKRMDELIRVCESDIDEFRPRRMSRSSGDPQAEIPFSKSKIAELKKVKRDALACKANFDKGFKLSRPGPQCVIPSSGLCIEGSTQSDECKFRCCMLKFNGTDSRKALDLANEQDKEIAIWQSEIFKEEHFDEGGDEPPAPANVNK